MNYRRMGRKAREESEATSPPPEKQTSSPTSASKPTSPSPSGEPSELQVAVWAKREDVVAKQALVDFLFEHVQKARADLDASRAELQELRNKLTSS